MSEERGPVVAKGEGEAGSRSAGESIARDAVANFLTYGADTIFLVDLTRRDFRTLVHMSQTLGELDEQLNRAPTPERESLVARASTAKSELDRSLPLLHNHALMGAWGALESCVDDIALGWLLESQASQLHESVKRIRAPLGDFLFLDEPDRSTWLLGQVKRERGSTLKPGIGQFESLLEDIGLGGSADENARLVLHYAKALRNVVAHRGGRADNRLTESCPKLGFSIGEQVSVTEPQLFSIVGAMVVYVESLFARFGAASGDEVSAAELPPWIVSTAELAAPFHK